MKHIFFVLLFLLETFPAPARHLRVTLKADAARKRVDVRAGNRSLTALRYADSLKKPVLYPLRSPSGIEITRGYPLENRPYERADHPHQIGVWLNAGNVNGLDFWNNSTARPVKDRLRYGAIRLTRILGANEGRKGILRTESYWETPQGTVLLREETTYIFRVRNESYTIDRITTLYPVAEETIFTPNKEGLIAVRLDKAFETPETFPDPHTDEKGKINPMPVLRTEKANGVIRNDRGATGEKAVVFQPAEWVSCTAEKDGKLITIMLFDHPANTPRAVAFTRGYGLFALNNLAEQAAREPVRLKRDDAPLRFRHRIAVFEGTPDAEAIRNQTRSFTKRYD